MAKTTKVPEKACETCYGYGIWAVGLKTPMGPLDASDGMPTTPCPECGKNANPVRETVQDELDKFFENKDERKEHTVLWKEWRSGRETVGFVAVADRITGKWRAYVGVAKGENEEEDAWSIADWGAKLSPREAQAFFPMLDMNSFDYE